MPDQGSKKFFEKVVAMRGGAGGAPWERLFGVADSHFETAVQSRFETDLGAVSK